MSAAAGNQVGNASQNVQPLNSSSKQKMACDSCGFELGNQPRWCENCKCTTCSACVLDEHKQHEVISYLKASRESKATLEKFRGRMRNEESQLQAKRQSLKHLDREIMVKLDADAAKVHKRTEEAAEVGNSLKVALEDMEKLIKAPLNGKNACERSHAKTYVLQMIEVAVKRQKSIGKQMQSANALLDEMYGSIGLSES